jgi:hypothetical protein
MSKTDASKLLEWRQNIGITAGFKGTATLSYSSGGSTGTVVAVFTANGSDALPVTIAKEGISPSIKSTVRNLLQTVLNATATLAAIGDQLTITDTITP